MSDFQNLDRVQELLDAAQEKGIPLCTADDPSLSKEQEEQRQAEEQFAWVEYVLAKDSN